MKRVFGWTSAMVALLTLAGCGRTQATGGTATRSTSAQTTTVNKPVTEESASVVDAEAIEATLATIGEKAPTWENLTGVDGKQHSLKDLDEAAAVAVVFTCNRCPVAMAYEDRLVALANDYKEKGVEVVAINVNSGDAEQLPAMKERATEKGFTFAYLSDPSQASGRAYGATVTPHVFLLNKDRDVVYIGAIDDNQDASQVEHHYLRDAIDAVLAGKAPEVATTKQFGCGIRYE